MARISLLHSISRQSCSASRFAHAFVWLTAVASALLLHKQISVDLLFGDSIQHLSCAHNLLNGHGFATSVLLYPLHYGFGTIPAPQTLWPPGAAFLAAALGLLGLDLSYALVIISIVAVTLITPVIYISCRTIEVRPKLALAAALTWVLLPSSWSFAIRGMTEGPFALFVMLAIYSLARASCKQTVTTALSLLAAGGFATAAFLFRYQGIYLLPALTFGSFLAAFREPSSRFLRSVLLVIGLPTLVIGVLFTRNMLLTGFISGGQFETIDPQPLLLAFRKFFWIVDDHLLELFPFASTRVRKVLLVAWVSLATWYFTTILQHTFTRQPFIPTAASVWQMSALTFITITITLSLWNAITIAEYHLTEARYITVLMPCALVMTAGIIERVLITSFFATRNMAAYISNAVFAILILTGFMNINSASFQTHDWRASARYHVEQVRKVLNDFVHEGIYSHEFIQADVDAKNPILSSWPQEFYLLTGRHTVGLTEKRFTNKLWDSTATFTLCDSLGVTRMLVISSELNSTKVSNQPFFYDLSHGASHPRLTLIAEVPGARLFRILPICGVVSSPRGSRSDQEIIDP